MPSYCIHLAIGNLYAKKNAIKDKKAFDEGIIAPDFAKDKLASHYSDRSRDKSKIVDFLSKKVMLADYLAENEIDSDFKRGEFLHLVTDYIYFTQFFDCELIESLGPDEFLTTMYYSYDLIKEPIETEYVVEYPGDLAEVMHAIDEKRKLLGFDKGVTKQNILPLDKLNHFIEFCSNINLDDYREKIIARNKNVIPDEGEFC